MTAKSKRLPPGSAPCAACGCLVAQSDKVNAVLRAARFRVWEEPALPDDECGNDDKPF